MIDFDGQVALITGAGRGLGAAYAKLLAGRRAKVMVHDAGVDAEGTGSDRSAADGVAFDIIKVGGKAAATYELLGSRDAGHALVARTIEMFGRIDILIHNAGLVVFEPIETIDEAHYQRMLDVHVNAPFWLAQVVIPHMRAQGYGRIVLTTSGRAINLEGAVPQLSTYNIGKMAQIGLMNALAVEGKEDGIRANAISPVAATRMLRRSVEPGTFTPEQVPPGVAYLASRDCDLNGVILHAANGRFSLMNVAATEPRDFNGASLTPEAIGAGLETTAS